MAKGFQNENQLWKQRATHGREKLFAEPPALWEAACEYFQWCDDNPMYEQDIRTVDKELVGVSIPRKRPYTLHGLCIFLGVNTAYFRQFRRALDQKRHDASSMDTDAGAKLIAEANDFSTVIEGIEDIIYKQKFEGAAAGFFNANIISRDLGLADKRQVEGNINLSDSPVEFD